MTSVSWKVPPFSTESIFTKNRYMPPAAPYLARGGGRGAGGKCHRHHWHVFHADFGQRNPNSGVLTTRPPYISTGNMSGDENESYFKQIYFRCKCTTNDAFHSPIGSFDLPTSLNVTSSYHYPETARRIIRKCVFTENITHQDYLTY
jgi:hypothetical protein